MKKNQSTKSPEQKRETGTKATKDVERCQREGV